MFLDVLTLDLMQQYYDDYYADQKFPDLDYV